MEIDHLIQDEQKWVLPRALEAQAATHKDRPFVVTVDGETLTYAQTWDHSCRVAEYFRSLGVNAGDRVIVMAQNSADFVRIWAGLARLGATMVALNTELRGAILESQVRRSLAKIAIVSPGCWSNLSGVIASSQEVADAVQLVVFTGPATPEVARGWQGSFHRFDAWRDMPAYDGDFPKPNDIACILYTSGTTGPSKGVLIPQAYCFACGVATVENCELTVEDINYLVLPLYHINGLFMHVYGALVAGATVVLRERFSATHWLSEVTRYQATMACVVAAMTSFVFAQPASEKDRQHRLRLIMAGPNVAEQETVWHERFGVREVMSCYGMTECNMVIWGKVGETRPGSVGKAYSRFFDVRIVDSETDRPVPIGSVGEIVVRPKQPFLCMEGYDQMPEKTVEATRNLWFHTGDAAVMDSDGFIFFLDRMKDRIRRRGENISSFDVEEAMLRVPGVKEAAAYAIPSEVQGDEDEIMVAVVVDPDANVLVADIARAANDSLPRFSRPRYVEVFTEIPRTRTHKIQKGVLRERGITENTWDAQAGCYVKA